MQHDKRHGGPYDRGSADSYYGREFDPHYFVGASFNTPRISLADMNITEIISYTAGFNECECAGAARHKKEI